MATLMEHAPQVSLGLKRIPKNGPDYTPPISSRVKCEIPRSRVTRMSVATGKRSRACLVESSDILRTGRKRLRRNEQQERSGSPPEPRTKHGRPRRQARRPSGFLQRTQQCARHADTGLVWLNHSFRFFGLTDFGACFYRRQTGFYSANRYQLASKLLASRQVRGLRQTCRPGEPGGRGAA